MVNSINLKAIWFCQALFLLLLSYSVQGQLLTVKHAQPEAKNDQRNHYYLGLLTMALEKTRGTHGDFVLASSDLKMQQGRALNELKRGANIDVVWSMSTQEREAQLIPVRIPLLKGLLGHRVFIIRKADEGKFSHISDARQLKQLVAGQGHDWPDTRILRANGFPVMASPSYEGLFDMLNHERFDYMPRGIQEPWSELASHKGLDFTVERSLLLKYRAPIYFFVNLKNNALAQRIEKGLRIAINDGSFDDYFYNCPANKQTFKLAALEKRKIFELENPYLSAKTPIDDDRLWYGEWK
ncbi:MAG: hypothetical protein V7785_15505 [Bermanella sp.]